MRTGVMVGLMLSLGAAYASAQGLEHHSLMRHLGFGWGDGYHAPRRLGGWPSAPHLPAPHTWTTGGWSGIGPIPAATVWEESAMPPVTSTGFPIAPPAHRPNPPAAPRQDPINVSPAIPYDNAAGARWSRPVIVRRPTVGSRFPDTRRALP